MTEQPNSSKVRILAGFYTNNNIRHSLLEQTTRKWVNAAKKAGAIPILSSWEPIPEIDCQNVISKYKNNGHLNIVLQLYQIIHSCEQEWDYFAFCEHDCLYPEDYFVNASKILSGGNYSGIDDMNHIGLRQNGYNKQRYHTGPLSSMMVSKKQLLEELPIKLKDCIMNGWCYLEPSSRTNWYVRKKGDDIIPIVHVNMDMTKNSHHLTSHYDVYDRKAYATEIPYWGDYRKMNIFTEEEIEQSTKKELVQITSEHQPILFGDYKITNATYGTLGNGDVVSFMPPLNKLSQGEKVFADNETAGSDPAPGVIKRLRVEYVKDGKKFYKEFAEHEQVRLQPPEIFYMGPEYPELERVRTKVDSQNKKDKLIVAFFEPNHGTLSTDFECMYKSWKFSGSDETSDLMVVTNKPILNIFGKEVEFPKDVIIVKVDNCPCDTDTQVSNYRFLNSIGCFLLPEVKEIMKNYDYVLRSDLDVFFLPMFKNWRPETFVCGRGGYSNGEEVTQKCMDISTKLGMRHQGAHNLGSSFIASPEKMISICEKTWNTTKHILQNEFTAGPGEWPGWFKGVSLLYGAEIAINDSVDPIISSRILDIESSDTNASVNSAMVAHCWHNDGKFSKFHYFNRKYTGLKSTEFDPTKSVSDYCMHVALLKPWF